MGFFGGDDVKIKQLTNEVLDLKRENQALAKKNSEFNLELKGLRESARREIEQARIESVRPVGGVAILVRLIGFMFVLTSMIFGYLLATRNSFTFDIWVAWAIYLFCQFSGLYLVGYGRKLNYRSMQIFAIYLTVVFLVASAVIVLSLLNVVFLKINSHLIGLAAVNSVGIAVLIYVEGGEIRGAKLLPNK